MLLDGHGEAHSRDQGRCEARPVGWEDLCGDLRGLILGKLSLRDLVRAATVCREFRAAFSSCVTEERAALIATAEEAYGKAVFSTFVTELRCSLAGGRPLPQVAAGPSHACSIEDIRDCHPVDQILFLDGQEPRLATLADNEDRMSSGAHFAMIRKFGCLPYASELLQAKLYRGCLGGTPNPTSWSVIPTYNSKNTTSATVIVSKEEAGSALAVLLAVCRETPEVLPAGSRRPMWLNVFIGGGPTWAAGMREAEKWVPLLSSLAHSVKIEGHVMSAPLGKYEVGTMRPLGNVAMYLNNRRR